MARLPVPGSDDGRWGYILNEFLSIEHDGDGSLKNVARPGDLAAKADDSTVVHISGNETITGTKTFSASPIVPTPTNTTHATTKAYVDSAVAGFSLADGSVTKPKLSTPVQTILNNADTVYVAGGTYLTGADPTGTNDSTAAFQAAVNANETTIIPTGTYKLGHIIYTGTTRHLRAEGPVTIIQTNANGVFHFTGGWDNLGAISSYATVRTNLVDAGESAPATSDTWVSVLTMASAASVKERY